MRLLATLVLLALVPLTAPAVAAQSLHAAVLPNDAGTLQFSSNSVSERRFFATLINDTEQTAERCRIELASKLPLRLDFYATEPVLNRFVGPTNSPVSIAPFSRQTFGFTLQLTANEHIPTQHAGVRFVCDSLPTAPVISGINDVLLKAGEPPVPDLLHAIATDHPDNRLVLEPAPGGEPCQAVLYQGGDALPCAIGAVALAVLNLESKTLPVRILARGSGGLSLLCRTNSAGQCTNVAPQWSGIEAELFPGEIATFSAFFLSVDDNRFGSCCGSQEAGFDIQELSPLPYVGVRSVATAMVPVESPPFEWSARVVDDELSVEGSVWAANGCPQGSLTEVQSGDSGELRLQLAVGGAPTLLGCSAAFTKNQVRFNKPSMGLTVERVVVGFDGADDLVLSIERD